MFQPLKCNPNKDYCRLVTQLYNSLGISGFECCEFFFQAVVLKSNVGNSIASGAYLCGIFLLNRVLPLTFHL